MRTFFAALAIVAFPVVLSAQSDSPPWPNATVTSCPVISAPVDPSQRTWKHGQAEQDEYAVIDQMLKARNLGGEADAVAKFANDYPDSDYLQIARGSELAALLDISRNASLPLNARNELVRAATALVQAPADVAPARMFGFFALTLASVQPDDPEKERKLADLDKWQFCGRQALAAMVRPQNASPEAFDTSQKYFESQFDRTAGYVAFMRQNYLQAISWLETTRTVYSQDALTYMLLGDSYGFSSNPDYSKSIFYLARGAELAPQNSAAAEFLKQLYVFVHGSDKGLADVRALAKANTVPPQGFKVEPPKQKRERNYAAGIAATALLGLLFYEAARHPDVARGIVESFSPPPTPKMLIFGGADHRVYLGCLSCPETSLDSVINFAGPHGSRIGPESIWNGIGQYGSRISPFSACNPLAADPPVIVDSNGTAYGRLTANTASPQIGMGNQFASWLASSVCQN